MNREAEVKSPLKLSLAYSEDLWDKLHEHALAASEGREEPCSAKLLLRSGIHAGLIYARGRQVSGVELELLNKRSGIVTTHYMDGASFQCSASHGGSGVASPEWDDSDAEALADLCR